MTDQNGNKIIICGNTNDDQALGYLIYTTVLGRLSIGVRTCLHVEPDLTDVSVVLDDVCEGDIPPIPAAKQSHTSSQANKDITTLLFIAPSTLYTN